MREDKVEILSDTTNAAIMRHLGRRFPGVLIQGDQYKTVLVELGIQIPFYEQPRVVFFSPF